MKYYLGVDVGTGSVRSGVFDETGMQLGMAVKPIAMWKPKPNFVEQSSDNIWLSVRDCVKRSLAEAGIDAADIHGIGFDATCSLVVIDDKGKPVTVSPDGSDHQNVIVWMDHRARSIADEINAGEYDVLKYVGGKISPEMETPKLVWLKRNMPESWNRAAHFFDLPDYLTWRATGATTRSLCSTVCKWTYLGHEQEGWDANYFKAIGLDDLVDERFERLGTCVRPMGEALCNGLSNQAAEELGLMAGTAVSVSIIDAHAGGIGMLAAGQDKFGGGLDQRIAMITGTSACHMAVSPEPRFVDGVWGPYYSAMVPGMWLTEGGQSAVGSLVDRIIFNHGASSDLLAEAEEQGLSPYEVLNGHVAKLAGDAPIGELTRDLHVCPYFHGNRSPHADPHLTGMICGLGLSATLDDLGKLYLATVQALAYGTRHIIESLNGKGYKIDTIVACGGGTKSPLFLQQHADITGCRIVLPREQESVLLGSAMLGATADGRYASLQEAMVEMAGVAGTVEPDVSTADYHSRKYRVFHKLYDDQLTHIQLMKSEPESTV
jgi:FGGY-family pentulose kinase